MNFLIIFFVIFVVTTANCTSTGQKSEGGFKYPSVYRNESVVTRKFGLTVKDPYRWQEDLLSSETRRFIADQNAVTRAYVKANRNRDRIYQRYVATELD